MSSLLLWGVVTLLTVKPDIWRLLQIRSVPSFAHLGQSSLIWAVVSAQSGGTDSAQRTHPLKTILRVYILTAIAVVNRAIHAVGIGDSLLVELQRGLPA